jgi:hypothetical protein
MSIIRTLKVALVCIALFGHLSFAQLSSPRDPGLIGGGGIIGWMSLTELEPLNNLLSLNGFSAFLDGFPTLGYWGHSGSLLGWRFGGIGIYGQMVSRQKNQTAKLEFNYSGLTLDYGLFFAENYDISAGAIIGGGNTKLSLIFNQPSSFEDAIVNPSHSELVRDFILLQPRMSIGFNLWVFHLQLGGGYLLTFPSNWQQQGIDLSGPPSNFNGWSLELLISFGWNYPESFPGQPENQIHHDK